MTEINLLHHTAKCTRPKITWYGWFRSWYRLSFIETAFIFALVGVLSMIISLDIEDSESKTEGFLSGLFGENTRDMIVRQKTTCYENGYAEYDLGYCKRVVNGNTEVINVEMLR